eukprot:UN08428
MVDEEGEPFDTENQPNDKSTPSNSKVNTEKKEHESIVVVQYARQKAGLIADRLIGEFHTVIKPFGKYT